MSETTPEAPDSATTETPVAELETKPASDGADAAETLETKPASDGADAAETLEAKTGETAADGKDSVESTSSKKAVAKEAASAKADAEPAPADKAPQAKTPQETAPTAPKAPKKKAPVPAKAAKAGSEAKDAPKADKPAKGTPARIIETPADTATAPAVLALQEKLADGTVIKGKVIGWNKGGFHVVCEGVTAFCPNSEMEFGKVKAPKDYLDKSYDFAVLRIEDSGRRVVLSRNKILQGERTQKRAEARKKVQVGAELEGKVATLTSFGAFVDLGGVQGLVHVSEISRSRVEDPANVLSVGQTVQVKVLKVEQGGKRISLSMKALEPDPWREVSETFPEGSVVPGTVERTASFGAFINLAPGLTGLLPASVLNLPRDAQINRMYSPGKQVQVMVMSVDPRRRRISLALEGSQSEGSKADFDNYRKSETQESATGFNAMAAAFDKISSKNG